jgi:DNA polymerase beta
MTDYREPIIMNLELLKKRDFALNDKWKVRAYDKVIKQLKALNTPITSLEDLKDISGIGTGILKNIKEIMETGGLEEVKQVNEEVNVVTDLSRIFGIGPVRARELYEKHGITSVEQLETRKELLNDKQIMGMKYYKDFELRIPRKEMDKHSILIKETINNIDPKFKVEIMGSYRRGAKDSGDIDVLITHEEEPNNVGDLFSKIILELETQKYLVDTFAKGNKKYNGVSKLKRHRTFRRVDLMYTDKKQYPFALLYFTGSQEFNIQLRSLALTKGYSLNEYGLKYVNGDKKGDFVEEKFETEENVLNFLGLKNIIPTKRSNVNIDEYKL